MTADPFRSGAFAPVTQDLPFTACSVTAGRLPVDIAGRYVRNGPNTPLEPAGPYAYPIDGDGMLHEIQFPGDGTATYRRAFVRTPMLQAELDAGRALWGTFMMGLQPLPGSGVTGRKDIPDVNVISLDGTLVALAEQTCSYAIDPVTLVTGASFGFAGQFPRGATAHPKVDPATGNIVVFSYGFTEPFLTWAEIGASGEVHRARSAIPGLDFPAMIHDCAITPRYLIVPVHPLVFDPLRTVLTDGPPLQWQPERGTHIAIVDRDSGEVTWAHTDGRWSWHTVNAQETEGRIQLDVVSYDTFVMADRLGSLERFTIDPATGNVSTQVAAERVGEFPRIDDRALGLPYAKLASATNAGAARTPGTFDSIAETDPSTGTVSRWTSETQPLGEPIHIPGGEGYWGVLTAALEGERSRFLVFEEGAVDSGPIAEVTLPTRVPSGLHGTWITWP